MGVATRFAYMTFLTTAKSAGGAPATSLCETSHQKCKRNSELMGTVEHELTKRSTRDFTLGLERKGEVRRVGRLSP